MTRNIEQEAAACAAAIRSDKTVHNLFFEVWPDSQWEFSQVIDNLAGQTAAVLFHLPVKDAEKRRERSRKLARNLKSLREAIKAYERQSGDSLPDASDVLYRDSSINDETDSFLRRLPRMTADEYLQALEVHLLCVLERYEEPTEEGNVPKQRLQPGGWVPPQLETPGGGKATTDRSTVRTWILHTLDSLGGVHGQQRGLLSERLSEIVSDCYRTDVVSTAADFGAAIERYIALRKSRKAEKKSGQK